METGINHTRANDPRASRGGLRALLARGGLPGSGPALFAQALLARHGAAYLRLPPVDLLLRPPARLMYVDRRRAAHHHLARLELHVHPRTLVAGEGGRQQPAAAPEMRWAVRMVPGARGETVVERFVTQITQRLLREESAQAAPASVARRAGPVSAHLPPPVAMVFPPRAAAPAPEQAVEAAQSARDVLPAAGRSGWPAAAPAPVVDVRGLTEQVLQALDQRLIAGRERMGRSG